MPASPLDEMGRALPALALLLRDIAEGVFVQDAERRIVFANDAGARLCGFDTAAALLSAPIADVLRRFAVYDESGAPVAPHQLPAQRVLAGESVPEAMFRWVVLPTGEERWSAVKATPVRDGAGAVRYAVSVFRDVTERWRADAALRFLADASAMLAESLDYETTLAQVARLAVPRVADWCSVEMAGPDGPPLLLAIAHIDPEKVALAREHRRRYPADPDSRYGAAEAIRTGRSQLLHAIDDAALVAGARDAEHLAMLRALGLASSMLVPLTARGRVLGVITFVSSSPARRYGPDDLALAEALAQRAALAIDNARLYRDAMAAEARYRGLFAGVGDAVLVTDGAGNYIDANPAMEALVGYSAAELRGLRVGDLTAEADTPFARSVHALPGGAVRGEILLRRKDGGTVPVEGWVTSVEEAAGTLHIGTWRDISERRRVDEDRQRFVAMVAHELRNPLAALLGYAKLMRRRGRYDAKAVETIIAQGERLERLTLDLRETVQVRAGVLALKRAPVDVRPFILAAVEQAQATTADHTIALAIPDRLPVAAWDADRVAQVARQPAAERHQVHPGGGRGAGAGGGLRGPYPRRYRRFGHGHPAGGAAAHLRAVLSGDQRDGGERERDGPGAAHQQGAGRGARGHDGRRVRPRRGQHLHLHPAVRAAAVAARYSRPTVSSRSASANGLRSHPAARSSPAWRGASSAAVRMTIGMRGERPARARANSHPSITGMFRSRRIRAGSVAATTARASAPFAAQATAYPASVSVSAIKSRMASVSSTTRMTLRSMSDAPPGGGPATLPVFTAGASRVDTEGRGW